MNNENLFELGKVEGKDQSPGIKEVIAKYVNYWWLFLLMICGMVFLAWLYLRYTTPKYKVQATLMVRADNKAGSNSDMMFSSMLMMQSGINKQNEIQVMRSRSMLSRVVRRLGLTEQYFAEGKVKRANIYAEAPFSLEILRLRDTLTSFSWRIHFLDQNRFTINDHKQDHTFDQPFENELGKFVLRREQSPYNLQEYDYVVTHMPEYRAAMQLSGGLTVLAAKDNSNLITLEFVTENSRLGADVLNTLMEEYNRSAIEEKNETNLRVLTFLEDRLKLVESQLDSVETTMMHFRKSKGVIDLPAQSGMYFQNLSAVDQGIREQEVQLRVIELLEDYITSPENRNNLVPSTIGVTDPVLLTYVEGYNTLVAEKQRELQTGAVPGNAIIQNLDKNIEAARLKIVQALRNLHRSNAAALATLEIQNRSIRNEVSGVPEKEKEIKNIARQQEIKQTLYLYILQKKEESSIALASTISNAQILDPALNIQTQISPNRKLIYSLAVIIGLLAPMVIIFLIDVFNDKVTTRSDITRATQAPIIGEIGHNEGKDVLIFSEKSRSVIAEQIRILRTNLRFQLGDKHEKPVILITSSFSGEGKSFVSTNLAAAHAIAGKRTVVLEFDLRKPKIMSGLGIHSSTGITTYLVGGVPVEDLPVPVKGVENFFVIPCGPVPPNPSEILLSERMNKLFSWLREHFDVIIIDTAPIGLVSDAVTLSQFADASLYVIRQRYTYKKQLQMIDEIYQQKKLPKIGLLVNDVVAEGAKGYYGYGAGRYGYGYGYGMGQEEKGRKRRKKRQEA